LSLSTVGQEASHDATCGNSGQNNRQARTIVCPSAELSASDGYVHRSKLWRLGTLYNNKTKSDGAISRELKRMAKKFGALETVK
jgi:hypothetical protein